MGPISVVGMLIALPVIALVDWFAWLNMLPTGQQELAKACHGAGLLALLAFWFWSTGSFDSFLYDLVTHPEYPVRWIPVALVALGLGWLLLNAGFASQAIGRPQRGAMIVRAIVKLGLGYAAWSYTVPAGWGRPILVLLLHLAAVWCAATGGAKLLLMLWGYRREQAYPMVAKDIAANEFDWDK
jgi:hypothetical protein